MGTVNSWPWSRRYRSGAIGWRGATRPFVVWTAHKNLAYLRSAIRLISRSRLGQVRKNIKPRLSRQFATDQSDSEPDSILLPSWAWPPGRWRSESGRHCAPHWTLEEHPQIPCASPTLSAPRSYSWGTHLSRRATRVCAARSIFCENISGGRPWSTTPESS